jgi:transposase
MTFKRIAVDTSKAVFTVHGIDEADRAVLRRDLSRSRFQSFVASIEPTEIVLEASGGAHHWGRLLEAHGHRVRLIPPQYVKPFVKRGKSDRADAQAICEAAGRPEMSVVPVRSLERQAQAMTLRVRERLVGQRTQLINSLRGHATEFGIVVARGSSRVPELLERLRADEGIPSAAMRELERLGRCIGMLDDEISVLDRELMEAAKQHEVARRLTAVPGIGPIGAMTLVLSLEPAQFESGRHMAAWLGLVPREHSSGGKQRLGRISKAGHTRIRQLLVLGATAAIRHARPGGRNASPWLMALLERKPRKLAAIALANKMARIVWAMMERGTDYRRPAAMA